MLYETPRKSCLFFLCLLYLFLCNKCTSKFVPHWNACCTFLYELLLFSCCTDCQIRIVRPPQRCCTSSSICVPKKQQYRFPKFCTVWSCIVAVPSSIFVLVCCLRNRALTPATFSSHSSSISFSCSLNKKMNQP
jgi:hypothetical protein